MEEISNSLKEIKIKRIIGGYIIIYFIIFFVLCTKNTPTNWGEWDDYCLPAISIINEGNISISPNDIQCAKEIFPEWKEALETYNLSGYMAKDGGEMSWYFPTYSVACIPILVLLRLLKLPAIYAFPYTNIISIIIMCLVIFTHLKISYEKKALLIAMLTINPIIFYYNWVSAESFIFALLGIVMVFWVNKEYKRAAIFISIVGSLNPSLLFVGIVMIIEYLARIFFECEEKNVYTRLKCFLGNWKRIVCYGSCYLIALIPFFYNYINTGHINLTASVSGFTTSETSAITRCWAYLTDLNYGILPYYFIALILSAVLSLLAMFRKQWNYLLMMISFLGVMYVYSIMIHINSSMSGIARYNAWNAVILIFAICCFHSEILLKKLSKNISYIALIISIVFSGIIVYNYGLLSARNTNCLHMTPIAKFVLNECPRLYEPLKSTFNSRINHIDGGYAYNTPIYYIDEDNCVRKILASSKDADSILNELAGNEENMEWLKNQVGNLDERESYISIPKKYEFQRYLQYYAGTEIVFAEPENNANEYVIHGLSNCENGYTWTDGKELELCLKMEGNIEQSTKIHANFELLGVYKGSQRVSVLVNGEEVYTTVVKNDDNLEFEFNIPNAGIIDLLILMPDATSPLNDGVSMDSRELSLCLVKAEFSYK